MAASPMAPPSTPATASNLPAPLFFPDVAEGLTAAAVLVPVPAAVDEGAAEEVLAGMAWTSVGFRVPQVWHA